MRWLLLLTFVGSAASFCMFRLAENKNTSGGKEFKKGSVPELLIYCAAGLKPVLEPVADSFKKEYGINVQTQYGGSGTLLSNLEISKTGDLFLAGDQSYIKIAREKNLIDETIPLSEMKPVLAVRKDNTKKINGLQDLLRDDVKTALANPDAASIGRETKLILESVGLWGKIEEQVSAHGVFKPTVMELANDLKLGAVDAAIVWDSTVAQYTELATVEVAEFANKPVLVSIAVLKSSSNPTLALRFARYLGARDKGLLEFKKLGYNIVEGDKWAWTPEITFFLGSVNRRSVEDLIKSFSEREGVKINTVFNGCGILTAQMRTIRQDKNGTGFPDLYIACDRYYLNNVKDWFQDDVDVSEADIVIAVPKGNPMKIGGLNDLAKPGLRIAVGQPQQCTIGALTETMLRKEGAYDSIMANVVMQTASSAMLVPGVMTKSVDAAIAYVTDTLATSQDIDIVRMDSPFAKAVQPFSIAKSSEYKELGRRMLEMMRKNRSSFEKAGFRFRLSEDDACKCGGSRVK